MIFEFEPWKLDIDIDATIEQYRNSECNKNINLTNKVITLLSEDQKKFFSLLGVDITKVDIKEHTYEFAEENPPMKTISIIIRFLMCGRFLDIPEFQSDLYWDGDEKIFSDNFPSDLNIVSASNDNHFPTYDVDTMAVIFKHPYFSIPDENFIKWDCGYVLGDVIIKTEL